MNTKYTVAAIAVAAISLLNTAMAADTPAAPVSAQQADSKPVLLASASTAASTGSAVGAAAAASAATAAAATKPAGRTREEVRAEAAEAVRTHRPTMSQQYDLLK